MDESHWRFERRTNNWNDSLPTIILNVLQVHSLFPAKYVAKVLDKYTARLNK